MCVFSQSELVENKIEHEKCIAEFANKSFFRSDSNCKICNTIVEFDIVEKSCNSFNQPHL